MEIKPSTHTKPDSDLDALTVELKMMERLIKKQEEKERKEVARKADLAASRPKKRASAKGDKTKRPAASKQPPDSAMPAWTERACLGCKKPFVVHKDWTDPPSRCKACLEKLRYTRVYGGKKSAKTVFSNFVIYGGGAPGLGKR